MPFRSTPLLSREHHRQTPLVTVTLQTNPPGSSLGLDADRFLCHQLIHQRAMLVFKCSNKVNKTAPLISCELKGPGRAANQHTEAAPPGVVSQAPARALLLNHPGRRSG